MAKNPEVSDAEVPDMFPVEALPDFPFLRADGNYSMDLVSDRTGLDCGDVSRTHQSFKDECDINTIVRRFGITGELPSGVRVPQYGDFQQVSDFHEAMLLVKSSEEAFMRLPAEVRERFENDPGQLVDFVSDPANRSEAEKLGLVVPAVTPAVVPPASTGGPVEVPATS